MQHHAPKENNNPKSSIVTTATTPYIKGASETIARMYYNPNKKKTRCPQTYNDSTTLMNEYQDKDEPKDRQGVVYKTKCCDCRVTYIGETGRNLNTRITEHKRATKNDDLTILLNTGTIQKQNTLSAGTLLCA